MELDHPIAPVTKAQQDGSKEMIAALEASRFEDADRIASQKIAADSADPYARVVHAIVRYKKTMLQLALDGRSIVVGAFDHGSINQKYLNTTLGDAERDLAGVEADLAVAAKTSGISMDMCIACWDVDWNGNGRIDDRDRAFFQIEHDEKGEDFPEGDPRRKPTFRFDDGDVYWARAFVAFDRAGLDLLLAYDWSEIAKIEGKGETIRVRLIDRDRVGEAKKRILEGLAHSDASRRAYLAETDDDREWMPNPRQKNHPMPLPVDQALYDTWESVIGDARKIVEGEEGISIQELATLAGERPHKQLLGYLDVGQMLSHPKDIVLDVRQIEKLDSKGDEDGAMKAVFGDAYVKDMKPSPLTARLLRMKGEIAKSDRELEKKLRYLLWIN